MTSWKEKANVILGVQDTNFIEVENFHTNTIEIGKLFLVLEGYLLTPNTTNLHVNEAIEEIYEGSLPGVSVGYKEIFKVI